MYLEPICNKIVIKLDKDEEKKTAGGLIIPGSVIELKQTGTVLAAGPGIKSLITGDRMPLEISVGDRVVVRRNSGVNVKLDDGTEETLIGEDDILAKVKEGTREALDANA